MYDHMSTEEDKFLCRLHTFGRLHLRTVHWYLRDSGLKEIRVDGCQQDGEIVCLSRADLVKIKNLLESEKREMFTLLVGTDLTYIMLDHKAAAKRVWCLQHFKAQQLPLKRLFGT